MLMAISSRRAERWLVVSFIKKEPLSTISFSIVMRGEEEFVSEAEELSCFLG